MFLDGMFIDLEEIDNPRPVFVYGSLLTGLHNHRLLAGVAQTISPATVDDIRLYAQGNAFPYALRQTGEVTKGEVVTVSAEDWLMTLVQLDSLESYSGPKADNHYNRVLADVTMEDGSTVEAWMYVASDDVARVVRKDLPIVPNGDWRAWKQREAFHRARLETQAATA